jgi:hypothetical protein
VHGGERVLEALGGGGRAVYSIQRFSNVCALLYLDSMQIPTELVRS